MNGLSGLNMNLNTPVLNVKSDYPDEKTPGIAAGTSPLERGFQREERECVWERPVFTPLGGGVGEKRRKGAR